MATYYVDPNASGSDTGADWTNAWSTMQRAIDGTNGTQPTAADIVYCKHTDTPDETLSAQVDFDGLKGSTAGMLRFIGTNSSGTVDGTRYHVDFSTNTCHGFVFNDMDLTTLENFEVASSVSSGTYHGISGATSASTECSFVNCYVHGWTGIGIDCTTYLITSLEICGCHITDNDGYGIYGYPTNVTLSSIHGNGGGGIHMAAGVIYGCAIYENTGYGIYTPSAAPFICNTVIADNTSDGIYLTGNSAEIIGCRITGNGGWGLNVNANDFTRCTACYFDVNSSGAVSGENLQMLPDGDSDWVETGGSDTDHGYVDSSTDDYNLDSDATMFNKALVLE